MKAKRFLSALLAIAAASAFAISVNAQANLYTYDESDGEYWDMNFQSYDKTAKGVWFSDGTVTNWMYAVPSDDTVEVELSSEGYVMANMLENLPSGWYEGVYAGLGSIEDVADVDLNKKIAIEIRGTVTFTDKGLNAMEAGAAGLLLLNNFSAGNQPHEADGTITGAFLMNDTTGMSVTEESIPMGWVDTDVAMKVLTTMTGASAEAVCTAIEEIGAGATTFSLPIVNNSIWIFIGTEEEYKNAGPAPSAEAAPETEPEVVETEPETEPEVIETEPETEPEVVETEPELVEAAETVPTAPAETASSEPAAQTFDAGILAAVAAVVSGAGYAIARKRK